MHVRSSLDIHSCSVHRLMVHFHNHSTYLLGFNLEKGYLIVDVEIVSLTQNRSPASMCCTGEKVTQ